jgi:hypothetical protein
MEHRERECDPDATLAVALGRAFARQRLRSRLRVIAILAVLGLVAIVIVLYPSYYWALGTQVVVPWILYGLSVRAGPVGVFLSWLWSSIITYALISGTYGYLSLVSRVPAIVVACIGGAFLLSAMTVRTPEMRTKAARPCAALVFFFAAVYSYSAMLQVNCLLDDSSVTVYRSRVLKKVYGFRSRGLLVESWSREQQGLSPVSLLFQRGSAMVSPSSQLFNAVHPGDTICVVQRKGGLGMSWFTAQLCPWNGGYVPLGPWAGRF